MDINPCDVCRNYCKQGEEGRGDREIWTEQKCLEGEGGMLNAIFSCISSDLSLAGLLSYPMLRLLPDMMEGARGAGAASKPCALV